MEYYLNKNQISREDALARARIYSQLAIETFDRLNTPQAREWASHERKCLEVLGK